MNELTNVTSNVNGWLPVQDGGTWRSDTDSYKNRFDMNLLLRIVCVSPRCVFSYLPGLCCLSKCVSLADLNGVRSFVYSFHYPCLSLHVLSDQ